MKQLSNERSGFTLVELMIVVAIIGLLAAIAIPSFVRARENSREKVCLNNLKQLDGAKDQAALENRLGNGSDVAPFMDGLLKAGVPLCPVEDAAYTLNPVGTAPECTSSQAAAHNAAYQ